jgi:hypothetical protein
MDHLADAQQARRSDVPDRASPERSEHRSQPLAAGPRQISPDRPNHGDLALNQLSEKLLCSRELSARQRKRFRERVDAGERSPSA